MSKSEVFAVLLCVAVSFSLAAATGCGPTRSDAIQYHLDEFTAPGEATIFAAYKNGSMIFQSSGPATVDSVLRFGSISKIFTGWTFLHNGGNKTDTPSMFGYPPNRYSGSDIINFALIGGHQGGIPEYATGANLVLPDGSNWVNNGVFSTVIDVNIGWKDKPLEALPGSEYCYCNTDAVLVGAVTKTITGKSVDKLVKDNFRVWFDDGALPLSAFPNTPVYQTWRDPFPNGGYPPKLPDVAGSLIGTPRDLLESFDKVTKTPEYDSMKEWLPRASECMTGDQSGIAGGDKYGFFMQHYNASQIYGGPSTGHDGDIYAQSLVIDHPSGYKFLFHYTQSFDPSNGFNNNREKVRRMNVLVTAFLG